MYLEYWGLDHYPFENTPDPEYFYEADMQRMVFEDINDAIQRRRGVLLLTGDIGCGKSTISQRILRELPESRYDVVLITYSSLSPIELLAEINRQLGLPNESDKKSELLHHLQDYLITNGTRERDVILCIDEAQALPDLDAFEQLRLLLNFQLPDRFLITMLLVGQPELQTLVARLPQLRQRIALHLHLRPMSLEETGNYVLHRLSRAGITQAVISKQAIQAIFQNSGGVPRRINNLCDHCLIYGMRNKVHVIDTRLVQATLLAYPE
ncbi:MAG: AAA family ATPase [Mariprofundales bacterium]